MPISELLLICDLTKCLHLLAIRLYDKLFFSFWDQAILFGFCCCCHICFRNVWPWIRDIHCECIVPRLLAHANLFQVITGRFGPFFWTTTSFLLFSYFFWKFLVGQVIRNYNLATRHVRPNEQLLDGKIAEGLKFFAILQSSRRIQVHLA